MHDPMKPEDLMARLRRAIKLIAKKNAELAEARDLLQRAADGNSEGSWMAECREWLK
jgi:hypothetical protein